MKKHSILIKAALIGIGIGIALASASCGPGKIEELSSRPVRVTHVGINKTSLTVYGTNGTLAARVLPDEKKKKNVAWSSSNTSVATINSDGFITGRQPGTATITVTTEDGGKTSTCAVTVKDGDPSTLAEHLAWLQGNAQNETQYTIEVKANEAIDPEQLSFSGRTNVGITLTGAGGEIVISHRLQLPNALFTVSSGVTLTLGNNITLMGFGSNYFPLVNVLLGGTLVIDTGSKITGNGAGYGNGVNNYGTLIMNGGEISGNIARSNADDGGGGVFNFGTFTMNGGKISGNATRFVGGGVSNHGIFTMNGGEISGNTANLGGGVYLSDNSSMYITNGTIYGSPETVASLRNISAINGSSSLFVPLGNSRAQYGVFNGSTWVSHGALSSTDNTIRVVNGQCL
jgi:hypothetical protein